MSPVTKKRNISMELPKYTSLIDGAPLNLHYEFYTAEDGVELAYQYIPCKSMKKSNEDAQTLLLLHGLGSSGADWELQVPALSRQFNLLIPDLRGFGASTAAYFAQAHGRLNIHKMSRDVERLLDHLGIFSCPVVGFSMGGAVALQMAVNHLDIASSMNPMCPSKLLILNSLPSFELDTFQKKYLGMLRLALNKLLSINRMAEMLSKAQFPNDEFMRQAIVKRYSNTHKKPYTAALNGLLGWHVRDYLDQLPQETLFVTADEDYSPVSDKEKYAAMMQNAKVAVIKNSKHGTPFDQTEALNKVIIEFFGS